MTAETVSPPRRLILGGVFASLASPRLAFARKDDPASQEPSEMKIKLTFDNQSMTATLYNNPTARDLLSLLPLDLTIDDYANNEKIAYLPRKLSEEGSGPFSNEAPGDLCYYAPWGNLAMFYAGYRWSERLFRIGRFDGGFDGGFGPLLARGEFRLHVERVL